MFEEFQDITNNEAYRKAFNERLLLPDPDVVGHFLGNTQRADFLPQLRQLITELPPHPNIFDVGAGAGEIIDIAFAAQESGVINLEEPNPILLAEYVERVEHHPALTLGMAHEGPLQDFYRGADQPVPMIVDASQQLVLAIHMIYHLTNFRSTAPIDPRQDIIDALFFLYAKTAPGGHIFLVYADQERSTTGQAGLDYFSRQPNETATVENLKSIWRARNALLRDGEIESVLATAFPNSGPAIGVTITDSLIYGYGNEDIAIICLTGELGDADDRRFQTDKLSSCHEFIVRNPGKIGLMVEDQDVPQKGMIRSNQPQVMTVITRTR